MSLYQDMIEDVRRLIKILAVEDESSSKAVMEAFKYSFTSTELLARVHSATLHLPFSKFKQETTELAKKIASDCDYMLKTPDSGDMG